MDNSATRTATVVLLVRLGLIAVPISLLVVGYALLDVAIRGLIFLTAVIVVVFSYVLYEVIRMGAADAVYSKKTL